MLVLNFWGEGWGKMAKTPEKSGESAKILSPCMDSLERGVERFGNPFMSSEKCCP